MDKWFFGFHHYHIKFRSLRLIILGYALLLGLQATAQDETHNLELKYLGTAGWVITSDSIVILIDPYISRLKLGQGPSIDASDNRKNYQRNDYFESDTLLINQIISTADFILVHHSHFDHLGDVPYIAQKTGAKVIGTETTNAILQAYGIPDSLLYTVKGGEDYQFEQFSVKVIPSLHSPLRSKLYFDSRRYKNDLKAPLRISEFIEGGSLMFLLRFDDHEILTMGSMNYIERELQGLNPEIILTGVNFSRNHIYDYTARLLKTTGYPEIIIPAHWDNYRIPYGYSQEKAIKDKIEPFISEVKLASPESRVIIPIHLEPIIIK